MRINNNDTAFSVWSSYTKNVTGMKSSMSRLSTGTIQNTDDPAGIGISERMRAQIKGTSMARQNTDNTISLFQTADSWMQKISDNVARMKTLATEAQGITSAADKANIQTEFASMQDEVTRITSFYTSAAKFNGIYLFRGGTGIAIASGDGVEGGSLTYSASDISSGYIDQINTFGSTPGSIEEVLLNGAGAPAATDAYADSLNNFMTHTDIADWFDANGVTGFLDARAQALMPDRASLSSADLLYLNRKCMDEFASSASLLPISSGNGSSKLTVQIGADVNQTLELDLKDLQVTNAETIGTVHSYTYSGTVISGSTHNIVGWNTIIDKTKMSVSSANVIAKIDSAVTFVAKARASIAAQQKRVEASREGLLTYQDNLTAAESKIRDVDMASESTNFSKYQILTQAANAMLAQANTLPNSITQLLG